MRKQGLLQAPMRSEYSDELMKSSHRSQRLLEAKFEEVERARKISAQDYDSAKRLFCRSLRSVPAGLSLSHNVPHASRLLRHSAPPRRTLSSQELDDRVQDFLLRSSSFHTGLLMAPKGPGRALPEQETPDTQSQIEQLASAYVEIKIVPVSREEEEEEEVRCDDRRLRRARSPRNSIAGLRELAQPKYTNSVREIRARLNEEFSRRGRRCRSNSVFPRLDARA